jgi:hypothetical protein
MYIVILSREERDKTDTIVSNSTRPVYRVTHAMSLLRMMKTATTKSQTRKH